MRASYIFDIYKCYNIVEKRSNVVKGTDFSKMNESLGGPTTYVEVTFAGVSVSPLLVELNIYIFILKYHQLFYFTKLYGRTFQRLTFFKHQFDQLV